jgi:N-methylhydantoinase A
MLSNGGVVSSADAAHVPIRMVESGPAAGALATSWYARRLGEGRILSFDMGGTTAKACLIEDYEPTLTPDFEVARMYRFKKGSGYPILVPSVDLVEIGAGGGSIARVDELGLLKVGPESAGANPGPACYGRGGMQPTVTDADLLLGYLDPGYFLGGEMPLSVEAAEKAFGPLADRLDLSMLEAAWGVHELVSQNMAAAARMHGIERGIDLRGVPLMAFGGAGPVHACGVAELLEGGHVVFPVNASVLSAFGTIVTPGRVDLARTRIMLLSEVADELRTNVLDEMREEAVRILQASGTSADAITFRYGIDARYVGQGNELTIWLGEGPDWPVGDERVIAVFSKEYEAVYGLSIPDVPIEVVTWRVAALSPTPAVDVTPGWDSARSEGAKGRRPIVFARGGEPVQVPVYDRGSLRPGFSIDGPALIEERQTSIVIRPRWGAEVGPDGTVLATRTES